MVGRSWFAVTRALAVLSMGLRDDDYFQSFDLTQNVDAESLDSFVQATVLKVLAGSPVTNLYLLRHC